MGVFSGLLNSILGGGAGGLGDLASKAMNIGSKLINRKEGESFGDALVGQLPAIAGGLGGLAKNFGGMIPGIGGVVSKIGGLVEDGAKTFEEPSEDKKASTDDLPQTYQDLPEKYKSFNGMVDYYRELYHHEPGKPKYSPGDVFSYFDKILGPMDDWENSNQVLYEIVNDGPAGELERAKKDLHKFINSQPKDINSESELMKHASNALVADNIRPTMLSKQDKDFPADSRGSSSSNWRSFKPAMGMMVDPLHDVESDNMYAANLPGVAYRNNQFKQTLKDLHPVISKKSHTSFRKNFIR